MKLLDLPEPLGIPALRPPGRIGPVPVTAPPPPAVSRAPRGRGMPVALVRLDPRLYQIAVLASLLGYGMVWLSLEIDPGRALAILAAALLT